ncbi:hypothetical protein ACHQM5_027666 [Ranunculus cassubicifolius]
MAYVPPHKRNSKEKQSLPSPNVDDRLQNHRGYKSSWQPPSKWFIVPSLDANNHTFPLKIIKWEAQPYREEDMLIIVSDNETTETNNPIIYVCNYLPRKDFDHRNMEVYEIVNNSVNSPWRCIEKEIQRDLVSSLKNLRSEVSKSGSGLDISPSFIVVLGTNFFSGKNVVDLESVNNSPFKTVLSDLYRGHANTRIPSPLTELIRTELITKLGLEFHAEREYYHVKVVDDYRPGYFICKCTVNKADGKLDLYKADESHCLSQLIKSAIIDPKEKGGLRWPVEDNPLFSRYVIDEVRHKTTEVFKSSTMKLKLGRKVEFCLSTSAYRVDQSVILEMTEIERKLSDGAVGLDPIIGMVSDTLKLLWEHFP